MEIRFRGLICHAQLTADGGKTRDLAIFMAYPNHYATLMVREKDVVAHNGPLTKCKDDYWCFDIEDLVKTSLGDGVAASRNLRRVPSLLDSWVAQGDKTPHNAARNRVKSIRYNAILDLPPNGNYRVHAHYKCRALFGFKAFGCIAHTVAYSVAADEDVRIDIGSTGHYVVVDPNASFYMDNRCPDCDKKQTPSHYVAYAQLFYGATNITPPNIDTVECTSLQDRDKQYCRTDRDLDVDCSNSRFP